MSLCRDVQSTSQKTKVGCLAVIGSSFVYSYLLFVLFTLFNVFTCCCSVLDSPISEHWIRAHPDCNPIYGVADGVHYVDIPYDKLMGMHSAVIELCGCRCTYNNAL